MNVFFVIEIIGTAAFACSGGMVAIRKGLDLLGIIVLGVTTAVGGGMIRDLLIGNCPPTLFTKPVYVTVAAVTVFILFLMVRGSKVTMQTLESECYEAVLNFMDAVGLGAFTVVGVDTAISAGLGKYQFLMAFLGVITGVGGGILRDMMAGETPAVLRKHIYACASLAGALCYIWLIPVVGNNIAMTLSAVLVIAIRVLARKFRWNLPTALPVSGSEPLRADWNK
jgi:uncharacterized membrane protein YeiH